MWTRNHVSKHADFASADAARTKWRDKHPTAVVDHGQRPNQPTHKVRVKQHAYDFKFIVWTATDAEGDQS